MLLIGPALLRRLARRAEAAWPQEICGLLVGEQAEEQRRVREVVPLVNRASSSDAFSAAPIDVLEAEERARCSGLAVVGVFHSHPGGCASPSPADARAAANGYGHHYSWLILPVRFGSASPPRAWTLDRSGLRFTPESLRRPLGSAKK